MSKSIGETLGSKEFKEWFAAVQAEAERREVSWLIAQPIDHLEAFLDDYTPADEVEEQIYAAASQA
jgi:hypothetical protein